MSGIINDLNYIDDKSMLIQKEVEEIKNIINNIEDISTEKYNILSILDSISINAKYIRTKVE